MNEALTGAAGNRTNRRGQWSRLERPVRRLLAYRPEFRTRRFWAVQGLVLLIAIIHDIVEVGGFLPQLGALYFIPITLFLLPVVYAALAFGFAGAVATAAWVTALSVPNWFLWHDGLQRLGVILQLGTLNGVSILVGWWVDRERSARRQAEMTSADLKASDARYRHLFESSPVSVLFLDSTGLVLEGNAPATRLRHEGGGSLKGTHLADLIGAENADELLKESDNAVSGKDTIAVRTSTGHTIYLKPILRRISGAAGKAAVQLVLRDVTEERNQRAGLKAYAASVIRAQEEERQRIARELHDETVQAVVLLCRQLDVVEEQADNASPNTKQELRMARTKAERVVRGLRDFATSLRPPLLDDLGLVASIRKMLSDLGDRCAVEVRLRVVGEAKRLLPDAEIGLYRIAQEALLNVERHSGARNVTVTIAFGECEVTLEVVDDGGGFSEPSSPDHLASAGHLGLIVMQERAGLLGGRLALASSPGRGTQVTVVVPSSGRPEPGH